MASAVQAQEACVQKQFWVIGGEYRDPEFRDMEPFHLIGARPVPRL